MGFPVHHSEGVDVDAEVATTVTPVSPIVAVTLECSMLGVRTEVARAAAPLSKPDVEIPGSDVRQRNLRRLQEEDNWFGKAP